MAVKVLRADRTTPQMTARFEQELKVLEAAADSAYVVKPLTGLRTTEEGGFYFALELLTESLSQRVAKGEYDLSRLLNVGADVAAATHQVHQLGYLHRDLCLGQCSLESTGGGQAGGFRPLPPDGSIGRSYA